MTTYTDILKGTLDDSMIPQLYFDEVRAESLDLVKALGGYAPTQIQLNPESTEKAQRWARGCYFTQPNYSTDLSPYAKNKEELLTYYARVKNWLQCNDGFLQEWSWVKFAREFIHPHDMNTRMFDPGMKGIPRDLYWAMFDAAVSRWADALPSVGFEHKGRFSDLMGNSGARSPTELMTMMALPPLTFFFHNPFPWCFEEYLQFLKTTPLIELLRYSDVRALTDYMFKGVPLPSDGIIYEYCLEIASQITGMEKAALDNQQMQCTCSQCPL